MPRSLGGFRNRQADDSQPEHARGCVRQAEARIIPIDTAHRSIRISRRGPWVVVLCWSRTDKAGGH